MEKIQEKVTSSTLKIVVINQDLEEKDQKNKMEISDEFKIVCEKLINQIEWVDFKDEIGHELKNNAAYTYFKDIVQGNK